MERDRATIAVRSPMSRDSGGQSHELMVIRGGQRLMRKTFDNKQSNLKNRINKLIRV